MACSSSDSCCCNDIPSDMIPEILSRLPVQCLLRFRSVSKAWRDLIDTNDFSKEHLRRSVESNAYLTLIIPSASTNLFSIVLNVVEQNLISISLDYHLLDGTRVLGCCNGLICLLKKDFKSALLFNPSTRRCQSISECTSMSLHSCVYGFGYDHVNDDYKLVMLVPIYILHDNECVYISHYVVHVYSLKSDSWTMIEQGVISYPIPHLNSSGKFVGGALHWVIIKSCEKMLFDIIAFDVGTEELREVSTPKIGMKDTPVCYLDVLGGSLCFLCNCSASSSYVDLWIMKEYGVESSWTKLASISGSKFAPGSIKYVRPMAYSKCGKKILLQIGFHDLCWYDLENKDESYVELHSKTILIEPYVLVDSLVHLKHNIKI